MKNYNIEGVGDILKDDGYQAVRNQNGVPIAVIKWEEYPHLFKQIKNKE